MDQNEKNSKTAEIFAGGGEMGERMRQFDWTTSPLGAPETWSQALKTSVDICLNSRFPMVVWWGRELVLLYNDGWRPILGANKDKIALGNRGETVWAEIWDVLKPMFDQVLDEGRATWSDDGLLLVNRYGYTEEAYFTWSYSPIRDDDGSIGGVFTAVTETTERFVGERRLKSLRDLGERTLEEARTAEDACRAAAETLAENAFDIPFALVYLLDADNKRAFLAESLRIEKDTPATPRVLEIGAETDVWQFNQVLDEKSGRLIGELESRFEQKFSAGAWSDDFARRAFVLPLAKAGIQDHPAGFLVAGISPRLEFNTEYRGFLELVGGQIATAIANARAYEEEKRRAEVLAELDRAKTEFFSNVSHEFRTPLTLMLGNLEEVLRKDGGEISPAEKERIEMAHRNSLRLLKLVNTLLDFSSIEANRRQINFELTDLSRLTADLAGNFRSAIEKAGLRLTVDCPPLSEEIPIDREMWEKIVLNLVSNAFKFTFDGEIKVSLAETEDAVRLKVSDTGVGIPAEDLPRVFDRFHRVPSTQGRTHEGTGIGLALVRELVKMHAGEISVESEIGQGTTFTVFVPKLRKGEGVMGRRGEETFSGTSNVWQSYLPDFDRSEKFESNQITRSPRRHVALSPLHPFSPSILLADDNADMREYVRRLLAENGYAVTAVADGQAALESLENEKPDLILSDVMMPKLDGFGLLEKIRADATLREIPFILLSARAGEESKVEGLDAGADDYLVKPFAARELVARVDANLKMARLRRESLENLRRTRARLESALKAGLAGTFYWDITNDRIITDENMRRYFSLSEAATGEGVPLAEVLPGVYDADRSKVEAAITEAIEKTGIYQAEYRVRHSDGKMRWLSARGTIERDAAGNAIGMSGFAVDITERKQAEGILQRYRLLSEKASDVIWLLRTDGQIVEVNEAAVKTYGYTREELLKMNVRDLRAPFTLGGFDEALKKAYETGVQLETFHIRKSGEVFPIEVNASGADFGGEPLILGIVRDISERKQAEEKLRASEHRFKAVFNHQFQFMAIAAPDGVVEDVNEVSFARTGNAPAEIFGRKFWETPWWANLPEEQRVWRENFEKIRSGRETRISGEINYQIADGSLRRVAYSIGALRDETGQVQNFIIEGSDITERNRAEEALRESEERLRLATQTAKMYSWEFDIQTQKGKMAKNSAQVLGISSEFMPKTLEEARALIHPEDRKASIRKSEAAITGNGVYSDEFRLLHPETDQIIWLEAHGTVIYDDNKKPTRFVGITQNITERKEIEENLRESEERYRIVAETASDAIFTIDDQSVILFVNHAAEKIFGYKMEEMLGQPLTMLMPESLRELHRAGFARYLATGKRHVNWEGIEVPGRRGDGSEFALEVSFGEFTKQNHKIFVGIARDITDRKAAEKTLRESEEQLRTLADSIPQLAWMAQPDGFIFWYNRKWYEYTGTTPKAMEGWGWQSVHDSEILPKVVERWKRSIETGEPFEMEFPLLGADGRFRWFLTRVNPLRDGEGRIVRWFGTNTDIEELRQARLQAEQANRLKDEFLATVSHELRTPLNAILGWSAMLQSGNVGEEIRQRADETIYRCAQSQAQLIEDLLDVSRIITGNLRIQPVPVNLASVVETAVETLRPAAVAKSIRIETNLECEPCLINGDAQRLQQIVWNLVSNAVKFTPEAGKIEIRLENENSRARLIVSDTGKGIEPEFLPFLFERFRQEDGSSTRRHGGLGLGLAIVRHLVELHGGWISARSDGDGKGATFIVELPLLSPIQSKKTSNDKRRNLRESLSDGLMSATDAPPRLEGVRVLLVDDEKDTLELLDTALTAEGAEVRAATSAAEAFEIFRKWQPDAIVSDIAMPDEDGYSLIKRIRQLAPEKGGATPAIAMTAYVRVEDRLRVLQSGFQMYVPKPAEPFEIITAVSNAAGQNQLP